MTETAATSFPELSQSLWFERKWSSLYEAFEDGRIDEKQLREVFAFYLPKPDAGKWQWIGIDASKIARPDAVTSADRTAHYVHNLPECKKPIKFGWQFSTVVALAEPASSWTSILDQQRVASGTIAIEVAEEQLRRLVPHLSKQSIVLLDRGYDPNWLWCRCSTLPIGVLGRLKSNRCVYRPAPAPTGKKGCPRKDGAKLQPKDLTTHGDPDGMWKGMDAKGRPVEVTCWKRLHIKEARWLQMMVLQVVRPHATFEQELLGRLCISCRTEEEIERVPFRINGSIQVHPLLFHLDGGFVDTPRVVGGFEVGPATFLQFGCRVLDPPIDRVFLC